MVGLLQTKEHLPSRVCTEKSQPWTGGAETHLGEGPQPRPASFTHTMLPAISRPPRRLAGKVRESRLTSGHTEQHSEGFAEQGPETHNSRHLHAVQVAFDLGDPRTCCHRLAGEQACPCTQVPQLQPTLTQRDRGTPDSSLSASITWRAWKNQMPGPTPSV